MAAGPPIRHGLWVSSVSIVWTVAVSATEVALGFTHHILSLVVFGLAGALDAAGSATLVFHFRHALRHDELSDRHERIATRVVSTGLIALGLFTAIESTRRLFAGHGGRHTATGTLIAAASVGVLAGLAAVKQRVGRRVGSAALVADGWLSASGAVLAVVAVVGATFASQPDRWWLDPLSSLFIAVVAGGYGTVVMTREAGLAS